MSEQFIKDSNKSHNNKYDYSLINYINGRSKVIIICPFHGNFEQAPFKHLQKGCKNCEKKVKTLEEYILEKNQIYYIKNGG